MGARGAPEKGAAVAKFLRECVDCRLKSVAEEVYHYFGVKFEDGGDEEDKAVARQPKHDETTTTTAAGGLGRWTEEYAILHNAVISIGNSVIRLQEAHALQLAEARRELAAIKAAHGAFVRGASAVTLTSSNSTVIEGTLVRRLEKALSDRNEAVVALALFKAEQSHAAELTQKRSAVEIQQSGGGSFQEDDAPVTNTFTEVRSAEERSES